MRRALLASLLVPLLGAIPAELLADAGVGFGESLRIMTSSRQAGTGGLPLEDLQSRVISLEAQQIYLGMGIRWLGLSLEGNLLPRTRVGIDGCGLFAEGIPETTEAIDGTFEEKLGTTQAGEYGWRAYVQQGWVNPQAGTKLSLRVAYRLVSQDLSGESGIGGGAEASAFGSFLLMPNWRALSWAGAGPVGSGEGFSLARSARAGAGVEILGGLGLLGGREGVRLGVEGERMLGGSWQAGVGGLYWLGGVDREGPGFRLILRAGARGIQESVAGSQVRFGLGVMMGSEGNYGWALDYGLVPFGDFGTLHYMSARILLGSMFFGRQEDFPQELN